MFFRNAYIERDIEKEDREQAKIAGRQAKRAATLERLLDGKNRAIGIDVNALDSQVEEKRNRVLANSGTDAAQAAENVRIGNAVDALRRQEGAQRQQLRDRVSMDLAEQIAHPEQRESYALNDRYGLRKELPVRMGDDDPRLGPCSAQVFGGEDVLAPERRKLQHAQQHTWLHQQMGERKERERAEKEEDFAYTTGLNAALAAVESIGGSNGRQVDRRAVEAAQYNLRLAEEVRQRRLAEKAEDKMAAQVSMETLTMRGAGMGLLAEDPADGLSATDPRRFRPEYYRGRPDSGPEATRARYEGQQAEREETKRVEAGEEAERVRREREEVRQAYIQERAMKARASEDNAHARAVLEEQIREREVARRAGREVDRTTPAYGPAFFAGFGKSLK